MRSTWMVITGIMIAANVLAGEGKSPTFTKSPVSIQTGEKVLISFAVSAAIDVEVAVLDAKGEVVRHLVAGMLGEKPPRPLVPGLAQNLEWDRRDDAGQLATGGPFKVRVALGLKPRFDNVIGWSGYSCGSSDGLTVGPDGVAYLIHSAGLYAHRSTWLISAFNKDGTYRRQVYPGPANLPPEKRLGWPRVTPEGGLEVPVIFHLLPRTTYPGAVFGDRMFPLVTGDGRLVLLSAEGGGSIKHVDSRGGRRLLILGTDGSVPADFLGPEVCPQVGGFGHIALSPDGKTVYATGFVDAGSKGKGPVNVVYRVPLDGSKPSETLIGKPYEKLDGPAGLSDPQGLDVDADGNIYVADYDHDRMAIYKPDGVYLDEIKVECPDTVHVSRKTGAIYVVQLKKRTKPFTDEHWGVPAHNWCVKRIAKFGGLKDKVEKAAFENRLNTSMGGGGYMALDESGSEPVLWVTGLVYGGGPILKIAEKGGKLESIGEPIKEAAKSEKGLALDFIGDVSVLGDKVLAQHPTFGNHRNASLAYSVETGAYLGRYAPKDAAGKEENLWKLIYGEVVVGKDERMYYHAAGFRRYDREGKWTPFETTTNGVIDGIFHGHTREAGFFIDRTGKIWAPSGTANRNLEDMKVRVYGADGKMINDCALHVQGARMGGIVVDRAGNIYVGAQAVPKDEPIPKAFVGRLPADSPAQHPSNDYKQNAMLYKFPPTGGGILKDDQGTFTAIAQYARTSVTVKNALWMKRVGYVGSHGDELGCHCETTRFDIDDYGRIFVPDIFRFRVCVFDGEGNELAAFGSYGNMDSRGPGSPIPEPEIPFGWPLSVNCGAGRAFVADLVNRRVVAVRFEHAVIENCEVR